MSAEITKPPRRRLSKARIKNAMAAAAETGARVIIKGDAIEIDFGQGVVANDQSEAEELQRQLEEKMGAGRGARGRA